MTYTSSCLFTGALNVPVCTGGIAKGRVKVNYTTTWLTRDTGLLVHIFVLYRPFRKPKTGKYGRWEGERGVIYS